jgi:hypothetical protein
MEMGGKKGVSLGVVMLKAAIFSVRGSAPTLQGTKVAPVDREFKILESSNRSHLLLPPLRHSKYNRTNRCFQCSICKH